MHNELINLEDLTLQQLDQQGLQQLLEWAAVEGWNPGLHDADVFWKTDPLGYVGYYQKGELIAGGSVVAYGHDFGFMGFFLVRSDLRGMGIGQKLWIGRRDLLRSRLSHGASIGMDGAVAMQSFFARGGFNIAFRDERYVRKGEVYPTHPRVRPMRDSDYPGVLLYDQGCFGFERKGFLIPWLQMPGNFNIVFASVHAILGFAVMRQTLWGYKIGPLFADTPEVAEALYRACLQAAPGKEVSLDIPVINRDAVALVRKHEATYVFECARMYYGTPPNLPMERIFGITTFELG